MIDWKKCSESMPEDNQDCILHSEYVDAIIGPIVYKADIGGWIDIFATKEAGHVFMPSSVTHWALWNSPPEIN